MTTAGLAAVALLGGLVTPTTAGASDGDARAPEDPIVFPVVGEVTWTDTFGDARGGGRTHEGQDLMGEKMQPLLAAADGTITHLGSGTLAGNFVEITAEDGWVYTYLHLNNDTPGTDDGDADADDVFAPDIELDAEVEAGQVIGYLGDSGNAEDAGAHLHFETKTPGGVTVNPADILEAAIHVDDGDDDPDGDDDGDGRPASRADAAIPRLAGVDRVSTAVAISTEGWPDGAGEAVVAAGDRYDEALPASVLAAARRGPLLLNLGTTLAPAVAAELTRLGVHQVTVIGSVPAAVEAALAAPGRTVARLGSPGDPVRTSIAIAGAVGGGSGVAVVVNQARFADGVSATSIAAGRGWPVLLTTADVVAQPTVDAWRALGVSRLVLVGGTAVVGQKLEDFARTNGRCAGASGCVVDRLAGPDRYATSVAVAEQSLAIGGRTTKSVLLGTGTAYPDVLASGPLAAHLGGVSLLVDGSGAGADAAARSFLAANRGDVDEVTILGGTGAVTSIAGQSLAELMGLDD